MAEGSISEEEEYSDDGQSRDQFMADRGVAETTYNEKQRNIQTVNNQRKQEPAGCSTLHGQANARVEV